MMCLKSTHPNLDAMENNVPPTSRSFQDGCPQGVSLDKKKGHIFPQFSG